jgi:hypothetical protein
LPFAPQAARESSIIAHSIRASIFFTFIFVSP